MIRERNFYKEFFMMWIVLVLQNVITLSVNLADNIMLGAYSEAALSGVAAVNQIQFVYQQILTAFGESVVIMSTQYFGKKEFGPIRKFSSIGMRFGILAAVLLFAGVTFAPHAFVGFFTTDETIIAQGVQYLQVIRFTYIFFAITQILLATLRGVGIVRISLVLSISTLLINCSINYTLIYGHFGAPELGVTGAAIGTLAARIAELLILVLYIRRNREAGKRMIAAFSAQKVEAEAFAAGKQSDKNAYVDTGKDSRNQEESYGTAHVMGLLDLTFGNYRYTNRELRRDYVRIMLPVLAVSAMWGLNNAFQNAILGHMTARAIAANSISSTLFLIVKSMAVGASSAGTFIIGKTIGMGDEKRLKATARTLQILFLCIGICAGVILYFLRGPILSFYQVEPETKEMADTFLKIMCVITVTMSYQMPTDLGIVRGGGDTKFVMKLDLISIWGIVLPLSYIMAFVVGASPVVVVWCLNSDQIFKCIPAFFKANFGHWAKKLTR